MAPMVSVVVNERESELILHMPHAELTSKHFGQRSYWIGQDLKLTTGFPISK